MSEPKIGLLDDRTANQIAAGEVVERPASVVKELVENAIDAGASHVRIELEEAGKSLIRVTDDGCGMCQEDAILSLQRHATSKIASAEDLFSITTMGFRGEAIPSIASVSHFTLVTREADSLADTPGARLLVIGGRIESVEEVGARPGTSVTVENLFYNVPARLKFLKSPAAELNQIVEMVQRFALAQPAVSFALLHHGRELFLSEGPGTLADAALVVFGRDTMRRLVPIESGREGDVRIAGFVGTPEILKANRGSQHLFVNRRFIRHRAIMRALDEGYAAVQTLHGQKFPVAVLLLEVDPCQVDVNVSPTKTDVRFSNERQVFSAVYHAVRSALVEKAGLVPNIAQKLAEPAAASPASRVSERLITGAGKPLQDRFLRETDAFREAFFERSALATSSPAHPALDYGRDDQKRDLACETDDREPPATAGLWAKAAGRQGGRSGLRVLGQTRNMYIVAQSDHALVLIDQHIAHERVLYERMLAAGGHAQPAEENVVKNVLIQRLVLPIPLELGRREALVVEARLAELARAGFELEPFGRDSFLVRAVPAAVAQKQNAEKVVRSIVDELVDKTTSRKLLVPGEEVLITASCKMAIKAGDPLTFEEMDTLLTDLFACENPYTCPHGRPIIVELPNDDLDRRFGRA